ncbi:nitrate- and nitrite sensing domain-containing protein [Krasilnikovia sp. MM14-A1004]|uniref:sensor histidine kinase n=1 Tax=Krasilnikovia sp. MM14-A1004 TaxID=3373541 RepID=UPI00399C6E52
MSKRPKPANAVMSRLRRPAGRLRDLPIWSKLGLIMLVPTLATVIVGVSGLVDHISEANNAERARTLSVLSEAAGGLVDHLQNERAYGVMITQAKGPAKDDAKKLYNDEHAQVDSARLPYAQQKAALDDVPEKVGVLLLRLDRNLEDLPAVRSQTANDKLTADDVEQAYSALINDLLNVRDASAQLALDTTLSDHLRAVAAVARAKDNIAKQRDIGHLVLGVGDFNAGLRQKFLLTDAGLDIAESTLKTVGTDEENALFNRVVTGPDERAATNLTGPLVSRTGQFTKDIPFDSASWESAMTGYNKLFRQVETKMDADIVQQATSLRDDVNRRVFIETSVLIGMLLLAITFAWLVARSMARSLRELRQGALSVAQYGLPQAVERLRDPTLTSSLTPAQVADQVAEPLPVRSRDEFGQVTEAFNAVHLEAVRTAAEQAALRSSVATMFVNLARRSQILVDRLIGHLDRLERGEEDPDRLAELFQLDHLATRMRRNDENLLVLAGADSTRVQREPAALIDVLRAAQSEVEHYTRIEFGMIDRDIEVSAHAVNDMVHLVAELFDNATAFSPPNSTVLVEARRLGDGALLSVEDRGIGISREQLRDLNERLANPPMVDVAVSRMMGLVVVARLANRHGVSVQLRPADNERGTVAEVGLPLGVLASHAVASRTTSNGIGAAPYGATEPAQRSPFAEPLALESAGPGHGFTGGRPFDPNAPMSSGGLGGGRGVPAWSDLTGAPANGYANGSTGLNGTNGFHGPRAGESPSAMPQSPAPQGFNPQGFGQQGFGSPGDPQGFGPQGFGQSGPQSFNGELPQRRNGEAVRGEDGAFGATIPRQLPANPESQARSPFMPPVSAPPVPPTSAPPVSSAPPFGGRPVSGLPASGVPSSAPPAQPAPPLWPPVAGDPNGTPQVPESLAAALDMTAELPRYRPERSPAGATPQSAPPAADRQRTDAERAVAAHEAAAAEAAAAHATAAAQIAAAQQRAAQTDNRYADETMELPIFRELESAWFTTNRRSSVVKSPDGEGDAVTAQRYSTAEPTRQAAASSTAAPESRAADKVRDAATVGAMPNAGSTKAPANGATSNGASSNGASSNGAAAKGGAGSNGAAAGNAATIGNGKATGNGTSMGNGSGSGPTAGNAAWQTAADEGWQAARAAAEAPVETTTSAGLPKRTPMAQLVPGGVDRGGTSVQRRTPEAVRGLLSAYHRGVQRGRTKEQSTNPEETPGGQQSSQAGKEHEA